MGDEREGIGEASQGRLEVCKVEVVGNEEKRLLEVKMGAVIRKEVWPLW